MKPPCTVVVLKILPAIRMLVAKELVNVHRMTPSEAARKMGLTQAAVAQYQSGVRGKYTLPHLDSSPKAKIAMSQLTTELIRDDAHLEQALDKLCDVCVAVSRDGIADELYEKMLPIRDVKCKLAFASGDIWDAKLPRASQTSEKVTLEISKDLAEQIEHFKTEMRSPSNEEAIYEALDLARAWRSNSRPA